ncbi:hypothetical protein B0H66DRAFT_543991 [Apodospora peruviana]|uniref:Uncharacterized protein n=1 Tax=Apodospora peruviana TaxID=516989 RepID=A0AAE0ISN9_9PEZI|nr:hypothetical protein B0H66DRAFT_543991 [Apodospora peruviana]
MYPCLSLDGIRLMISVFLILWFPFLLCTVQVIQAGYLPDLPVSKGQHRRCRGAPSSRSLDLQAGTATEFNIRTGMEAVVLSRFSQAAFLSRR